MKEIIYNSTIKWILRLMILFLNLIPILSVGQVKQLKDVVITGKVITKLPADQIQVVLSTGSFAANASIGNFKKQLIKLDSNYSFRTLIKSPSEEFYLFLYCTKEISTFIDNIYMLNAGDEIHCVLSSEKFAFRGRGAVKLNCQDSIYRVKAKKSDKLIELMKMNNWTDATKLMEKSADSIFNRRIEIVNSFKNIIGERLTKILLANCYGLRNYTDLRTASMFVNSERTKAYLSSEGYRTIDRYLTSDFEDELLILSPNFVDAIFTNLILKNAIRNQDNENWMPNGFLWVYQRIVEDYSGLIRQKLLTSLFLRYKVDSTIFFKLEEAISIVDNDLYNEILRNISDRSSVGSPFSTELLLAENGKTISFAEFKGKVVLVDFWFTGCMPCQKMNAALKPIVEYFENNEEVKFVSVNVDQDRTRWLNSIKGGLYTHKMSINLFAGESVINGKQHPILEKYKITGFPTLILLYDNRIYSLNLPRPLESDDIKNSQSSAGKLTKMISEAIKKL